MDKKTSVHGTQTSEGFIEHFRSNKQKYPVVLNFNDKQNDEYPPLRFKGKLVYALPGGKSFVV